MKKWTADSLLAADIDNHRSTNIQQLPLHRKKDKLEFY